MFFSPCEQYLRIQENNLRLDVYVCFLSPQVMHSLSQPAISSPCDELHCSHLCLLAPGAKSRSRVPGSVGAPTVNGPTAVCRCPKGLLLSKDKITCTLPLESTFILVLCRTVVHQVNSLILCKNRETIF